MPLADAERSFPQGHASDVPAKLRQDLKSTLVANWKVWVPFQFINFRFVPQSMQARTPLLMSFVAWQCLPPTCLARSGCVPGRCPACAWECLALTCSARHACLPWWGSLRLALPAGQEVGGKGWTGTEHICATCSSWN